MHPALKAAALAAALTTLAACGSPTPPAQPAPPRSQRVAQRQSTDAGAPWRSAAQDAARPNDDRAHPLPAADRAVVTEGLAAPVPRWADFSLIQALEYPTPNGVVRGLDFRTPIEVGLERNASVTVDTGPLARGESTIAQWAAGQANEHPYRLDRVAGVEVATWPVFELLPASDGLPERRTIAFAFVDRGAERVVSVRCTGANVQARCRPYLASLLAGKAAK